MSVVHKIFFCCCFFFQERTYESDINSQNAPGFVRFSIKEPVTVCGHRPDKIFLE